jgi:hypothetical protein
MRSTCVSTLTRLALALILVMVPLSASLAGKPADSGTGSITGTVVPPDGGTVDGRVEVTDESGYVAEGWLDQDAGFSIEGLAPGSYFVQYFDIGEIPLGDKLPVDVVAGRSTDVAIELPMSVIGMPCDLMISMGYRDYCATVDWAFSEFGEPGAYGLSEMGMDRVAESYGRCRMEANDEAMTMLTADQRELMVEIREALTWYDDSFWFVNMYGGTGAGHGARRAQAPREDFISDLIEVARCPGKATEDDLSRARDVMADVETVPQFFEEWAEEYDDPGYDEALDDFRDACEYLVDLAEDLSGPVLVALAGYMEPLIRYF